MGEEGGQLDLARVEEVSILSQAVSFVTELGESGDGFDEPIISEEGIS
jgi:hypothetical protein